MLAISRYIKIYMNMKRRRIGDKSATKIRNEYVNTYGVILKVVSCECVRARVI